MVEQGAPTDIVRSALTVSLDTNIYEDANRDKDVLQANVDINRALLNAGSRVDAIWVTNFYLFTITWRFAPLASLAPICEDYWEDTFKLLWGPYKLSHDLGSLIDEEGNAVSAIDELLYDLYKIQRNSGREDPWEFDRLELALQLGARVDAPSRVGSCSVQNFIARASAKFRQPGYGRWMEDCRSENEGVVILKSLLWLVRSGADPLAIDEHGQTATWLAFYCQLLPEWFAALAANGINTEYVARHALSAVSQEFLDGLGTVVRMPYARQVWSLEGSPQLNNLWEEFGISTVDEARSLMMYEFTDYGCKVSVSDDSPREYGVSITGADFDLPSAPHLSEGNTTRRRVCRA